MHYYEIDFFDIVGSKEDESEFLDAFSEMYNKIILM